MLIYAFHSNFLFCFYVQLACCFSGIDYLMLTYVSCTGDGGNDVSMIQMADVGVGIVGKVCRQPLCELTLYAVVLLSIRRESRLR